jgi:hypothetical protein
MPHKPVLRRIVATAVGLALAAFGSAARAQDSPAAKLGIYNADIGQSSISGILFGAFMAVQLGIAWSFVIKGVPRAAMGLACASLRWDPEWTRFIQAQHSISSQVPSWLKRGGREC